jgi:hypothetical protein
MDENVYMVLAAFSVIAWVERTEGTCHSLGHTWLFGNDDGEALVIHM